jgi:methylamine dehydrogenase accessory protein MauD
MNALFLVLLLALTRQIGVILVRLGPTVARETVDGLTVGALLDPVVLRDVGGSEHRVGPAAYGSTLLLFVAPGCQTCRELVSGVRAFAAQYAHDVRTLAISTAAPTDLDEFYLSRLSPTVPYIRDRAFADQLLVKATPFAILLDAQNRVTSKGIVNSLEQLESLLAVEVTTWAAHTTVRAPVAATTSGGGK